MFALNICIETVHNISSFLGWKAACTSWEAMVWIIKLYLENLMKTVRTKAWPFLCFIFFIFWHFSTPFLLSCDISFFLSSFILSHLPSPQMPYCSYWFCQDHLFFVLHFQSMFKYCGLQTSRLTLTSNLLVGKCGYQLLICISHWEAGLKQ